MRAHWKKLHTKTENASDFHREIQNILIGSSKFRNMKIYHEVPIRDLVPGYPDNHFLDWYIEAYGICIELHGRQHYQPTSFGGQQSATDRVVSFNRGHGRDQKKKIALIEAGFTFIEIPYTYQGKLTEAKLLQLLDLDEPGGANGDTSSTRGK